MRHKEKKGRKLWKLWRFIFLFLSENLEYILKEKSILVKWVKTSCIFLKRSCMPFHTPVHLKKNCLWNSKRSFASGNVWKEQASKCVQETLRLTPHHTNSNIHFPPPYFVLFSLWSLLIVTKTKKVHNYL